MLNKIWREAAVLLGICAVLWLIFAKVNIFPDTDVLEISIEQEERLAEEMTKIFDARFVKVEDSAAIDALDVVVDRLLDHMAPTEYNYTFHLVQQSDVNAFATLGGHIYVFSGLMKFTESPEELAAVLAHEIGHCEQRHVVHRLTQELGMAIIMSVISGDPTLAQELYGTIISNVFSRNQEAEADQFSFELLEKSNISPASLAAFFRRINRELGGADEKLEFLMTHPHNNSRIKAAIEYKTAEDFERKDFDVDWAAATDGL